MSDLKLMGDGASEFGMIFFGFDALGVIELPNAIRRVFPIL